MQPSTFSQLEREMHNSPLKCSTNDSLNESPAKTGSPKLQAQAYRNSGEKRRDMHMASPTKPTSAAASQHARTISNHHSPEKTTASLRTENASKMQEDPSYRSPPQKKFSSPSRLNQMSSGSKRMSPSKNTLPFGKSIEIIKSKYSILISFLS